jgi:conjugative transfer region protein TrbK
MDGKMLARLGLVIVLAVAITAEAIHRAREDLADVIGPSRAPKTETPRTDPLREMLRRCQQLGEAATHNSECLSTWDENRRRFLTPAAGK